MTNCYLCGKSPATQTVELSEFFSNHSYAKFPHSKYFCDRCAWVIPLRLKYYNPNKGKEVMLFARGWSWLLSNQENLPTITATEVANLPTRAQIRRWLINPPEPPFTICIAESGQKYTLPFAQEASNRDYFPVLLEHTLIQVNRAQFIEYLTIYEYLLGLGISKTEINSGEYRSQNLLKIHQDPRFWESETQMGKIRKSRYLLLLNYVAQVR